MWESNADAHLRRGRARLTIVAARWLGSTRSPKLGRALPSTLALWVGLGLVICSNEAGASVLGSLGTSIGLMAALAAMSMLKAWPTHAPEGTLSALTGLMVVVAGAAWWKRPVLLRRASIALPAGVDRARLLGDLRELFFALQAAWDRGDLHALRGLTLPAMLDELCASRPLGTAPLQNTLCTEIVKLRAELLGFDVLSDVYLVSIDFSGLMRDAPDQPAAPFREVWMLTKAKQGGERWRLARHQALL